MTATATGTASQDRESAGVELILLSRIAALPELPAVAARWRGVSAGDRASLREAVAVLESDRGLSARVLSAVGRPPAGSGIHTIDQAVGRLGVEAVRDLVLSIQVFEALAELFPGPPASFDAVGFWTHNLAVGCAARLLAEADTTAEAKAGLSTAEPEEAFVCGLLHDLGKVLLAACFPKSYGRVIARADDLRGCIAEVEREVFGLDHTQAGRRLAEHWKLPEMIRECIWLHHHTVESTPTCIAYPRHVRLVQWADVLARGLGIGYSGNYTADRLPGVDSGGPSPAAVDLVKRNLPAWMEARAELIGLDRLTTKGIADDAHRKAAAELAGLHASLAETHRRLERHSRCLAALRALHADLGDAATHEDVCRAAARAIGIIVPALKIAVLALSPRRSILVTAVPGGEEGTTRIQVCPASQAGDLSDLAASCDSQEPRASAAASHAEGCRSTVRTYMAEFSGGRQAWVSAAILPGPLRDWLAGALGGPAAWCRPIHRRGRFLGAFVTTDEPLADDESVTALSEDVGAWLHEAESRSAARQLTEELADLNRRLVASRAEAARLRGLAAVGDMAAGAAHELNNPLAVISGRAELLQRDHEQNDVGRSAREIAEHAHRASAIVSELMDFAKPAPPQPTLVSMPELLAGLRTEWIEKGALTTDQFQLCLSDDLPKVHADAAQTKMLFDAVIANAVEAMRDVKCPSLIVNCRGDLTDERVVIRIEDNGCGMTPGVMEQAMTPFFSHRPAGRGRGLGLSRASRYAEINGGRLRLSSRPDEGTVVFVDLPAAIEP